MVLAIIFLERMGLGRGTSWEIHSTRLLLLSWDPILFVIAAGLLSIFTRFLPFFSLLSLDLPPRGGSHIFSGSDPRGSRSQAQCPRDLCIHNLVFQLVPRTTRHKPSKENTTCVLTASVRWRTGFLGRIISRKEENLLGVTMSLVPFPKVSP